MALDRSSAPRLTWRWRRGVERLVNMLHDGATKAAMASDSSRIGEIGSPDSLPPFPNPGVPMPLEYPGVLPKASDRRIRPLSPALRAGDLVHVSGQVPADANGEGGLQAEGLSPCT
ncbi:hypothetical protein APY03_7444 [Variovorax sp. WDL1]|nr:hypothetical protein APY03_7444 [Variovorax sp. WDL1]